MARPVTVASIAWSAAAGQPVQSAVNEASDLLRQAAVSAPDLVIFPECFLHAGQPIAQWTQCDPLPNALTDHFGALARKYATNLVIPMPIRAQDRCYNSAVAIDRRGAIVGHYAKTHPTMGELDVGISPGDGPVVHRLDFGRIAHVICFDANFAADAERLRDQDVELITFHSMFDGGQLLNHWALTAGACLLSAYQEESRLVDMTGRDLMSIGRRYESVRYWKLAPILIGRLNLDRRLFHGDYNIADFDGRHGGLHRLLAERADKVTVDHNFPVGVFALGALDGVTLPTLVARYGLETRNDYLRRSLQQEALVRSRTAPAP